MSAIEIDDLTARLIEELKKAEKSKPNYPDDYVVHIDWMGRQMDEWQRQVDALRVLIGSRLVHRAVEQ